MKIRFGVGLGPTRPGDDLAAVVDRTEELGLDSLWLSEVVSAAQVDPMIGLTYAAARTQRLKLGTGVSVLPGRHPVLVAKQLASLAWLAPGRVLPVFGLQPGQGAERAYFPVPAAQRGAVFDESLVLLRLLLEQPTVTFHGRFFSVTDAGIGLVPTRPLDLWLGGAAPAGLRRVGRLADGWLGSLLTPAEVAAAIGTIQAAAADAGRTVDPEHFGISLPVAFGDPDEALLRFLQEQRPDTDPAELLPRGWARTRRLIEQLVAAGASKFVIRPAAHPGSWDRFLTEFAEELLPLQT